MWGDYSMLGFGTFGAGQLAGLESSTQKNGGGVQSLLEMKGVIFLIYLHVIQN